MEGGPDVALTDRRAGILQLVIQEYVDTATPVGSNYVREKYDLPASSATIRHEMQALEEDGYLTHPHTSAGRVPSNQGYRHFVESLMGRVELPAAERATVRHQFFQAEPALDEWTDLAATVLAQSLGLLAIVTPPRSEELRIRHMELISLHDLLALLVVVLREARVIKQLVPLQAAFGQAELSLVANRLNEQVAGMGVTELRQLQAQVDPDEQSVMDTLQRVMDDEVSKEAQARMAGLSGVLAQPEFETDHERLRDVMRLVDQRAVDQLVPADTLDRRGVRVLIGEDYPADELQDCSLIVAPYGFGFGMSGFVGLFGPTRMNYPRGVASVRFVSDLLQEMMDHVYGAAE